MISTTWANAILDYILSQAGTAASPANIYAALWIGDPGSGGQGGVEIVAAGYSRILANVWTGSASGKSFANNVAVVFGTAGESWGKPDYMALWKDSTSTLAADFLIASRLNPIIAYAQSSQANFAPGTLVFSIP